MQKLNFIFSSVSSGLYYRNRRSVKRLTRQGSQSLLAKMVAMAGIFAASYLPAAAQSCNTFQNADAANPILSVLPAGSEVLSVNFTDINGDGKTDCYVSFNDGNPPSLYLNKGTLQRPVFVKAAKSGFQKNEPFYSQHYIQLVDIDGDGDMDCFASEVQDNGGYEYVHLRFYQNTGTPQKPNFVKNDAANPLANIRAGNYIDFQFADVDGDGDLDFYYYNKSLYFVNVSYNVVLRNTGTKTSPAFTETISNEEDKIQQSDRVYYDWSKDGKLDYFASVDTDPFPGVPLTRYLRNISTRQQNPKYTVDTKNRPDFQNGIPYQIVDLNGDGAPEVFTYTGHYSTLAPVAAIGDTTVAQNGVAVRTLYSINRGADYEYAWFLNGKPVKGANKYSLTVTSSGTYTLSVKNGCGTGISLDHVVTSVPLTANNRAAVSAKAVLPVVTVSVYPNPSSNVFAVQLPAGSPGMIRITDLAGRILLSQTATGATAYMGGSLQKGIYVLQVWQNKKLVFTTKVIKE